jgi:DNA adenine methylase
MEKVKNPLKWVGGKYRLTKWLLAFMPPHQVYVEVFGGAAHLLFTKPRSHIEVYNDVNPDLVNFFRVMQDGEKARALMLRLALTAVSREEYDAMLAANMHGADDVTRAWRFFYLLRLAFGAHYGSTFGYDVTGSATVVNSYLAAVEAIAWASKRLHGVVIENKDWAEVIEQYDSPSTFFYLDPPYLPETRRIANVYEYELGRREHIRLVERFRNIKGMAMLSCYFGDVYMPLIEAGWQRYDKATKCSVVGAIRGTTFKGRGGRSQESALRTETRLVCPRTVSALGTLLLHGAADA